MPAATRPLRQVKVLLRHDSVRRVVGSCVLFSRVNRRKTLPFHLYREGPQALQRHAESTFFGHPLEVGPVTP